MTKGLKIPGLPDDLLEDTALEGQIVEVTTDRRRYGEVVTIISGFDPRTVDAKQLAKRLKDLVAAGGTAKEDHIELQGDHVRRIREELAKMGFTVAA